MKSFLKMLLASVIGGAVLLFIIFIVFASIISLSTPEFEIQENSILKIDLNSTLVERAQDNPLAAIDPISGAPEAALGLNDLRAALAAAKTDDKIIGVYLTGGIPLGSAASVKEIRDALIDFKSSGKFVYGYSEIVSQKGLYIATAADSFFVNPEGFLEWTGLSASVTYYKQALDKLGVEPVVFRATGNKFKSAVEPFLTQEMSAENKLQLSEMLSSLWGTYLDDIAASTTLSAERLNQLADDIAVADARKAAEVGLIDGVRYEDEMVALLLKETEKEHMDEVAFLSVAKYAEGKDMRGNSSYSKEKIALVIAQGEIQSGEGDEYTIGSQRIAHAIRDAREDEAIKAIVLRVNSPGGSALASEVIWREVDLARQVKPVIASFGGVAASGGYYISCFADTIVAEANTITGSIGAFGLFFTAEELLNEKLGINIETVTTNKFADLGTIDRDLTDMERKILVNQIDQVYNTFTKRVAEGRGLSQAYVDSVGGGRVYTGKRALELNLVDVIGGVDVAVNIAAQKAGIDTTEFRIVEFPEPIDPIQKLIEELTGGYQAKMIDRELGQLKPFVEAFKRIEKMQGLQTRMEYDLIID